jgi:hypothetical protein
MLVIYFNHICVKKRLVCYDYNQFCPLFDVTKNITNIMRKKGILQLAFTARNLVIATSHYATNMQLVVVCNYLGHVCNYKFGIVQFMGHMDVWAINMQLNVYNMNTCHKNNDLNLYILILLYLIYVHRLYIIILCTSNTKVNPMLT